MSQTQELAVAKRYFETFDYVRLAQLELLAEHIEEFQVPGDCAEVGVYKGHFAHKINEFFPSRKLFLFDTFEGFSERDPSVERSVSKNSAEDDFSDTSADQVLALMPHPEMIVIRKGFFPDTASGIDGTFAFVSLDVDLFKPTLEGLKFFCPRLSPGGCILIHDYNNRRYPAVRKALTEYFPGGVGFMPIPDKNGSVVVYKS